MWVAALAALLTLPARADEMAPGSERELVVTNHAALSMNEIYISPASADQWGADWLGEHRLEAGGFIRLRLGRTRACVFDLKIIYADASSEEQRGVNLCRLRQVAFDGLAAAPASGLGVAHSITLVNQSARPIQQVFISPAESNQWGDDRLGEGSISVADRRSVTWHGNCNVDLRVVFENRAAEERRGIDLCALPLLGIAPGWTTTDIPALPKATAPAELAATPR
jgi:hypothetical protein